MSFIPLYEMSFRQLCKIKIFSRFANPKIFRRLKGILPRCLESLRKKFFKASLRSLFVKWDVSGVTLSDLVTEERNLTSRLFIYLKAYSHRMCTDLRIFVFYKAPSPEK